MHCEIRKCFSNAIGSRSLPREPTNLPFIAFRHVNKPSHMGNNRDNSLSKGEYIVKTNLSGSLEPDTCS